ncbi:MAG: cobyric acid synthase, partial [Anaerolineae bacterium]
VNMAVALHAQAPVVLVGDIDKGGIFAQLLGTLWLLEPEERALVRGLIVNKFRGDPALFADGVRILEQRGGVPVLGVVPWLHDHGVAEEDSAGLLDCGNVLPLSDRQSKAATRRRRPKDWSDTPPLLDIVIIKLPRIANFDDFDPLAAEEGVRVRFVQSPEALGKPAALILPGTKHTLADLAWLRATGLADAATALAAEGVPLVGICGGYQMLGRAIRDPHGVEGGGEAAGLGLLPVEVVFGREKVTQQVIARPTGQWPWSEAAEPLTGYEIHAGEAKTPAPLLALERQDGSRALDGACSADGRIWGTHLHGLFHNDGFRRAWLRSLGWRPSGSALSYRQRKAASYDRLADALEAVLDVRRLDAIIGL